jgi:simple sugar transport system ATP-binding protein
VSGSRADGIEAATGIGDRADRGTDVDHQHDRIDTVVADARGPAAIRLVGVTKAYGPVRANDGVSLDVEPASIHGLLGENGAGKSTLMKILFGMIRPDEGIVEIDGVPSRMRSSADALAAGIGMVQQHFSLIDPFTVAENLALVRPRSAAARPVSRLRRGVAPLDLATVAAEVSRLSDQFGFRIDPRARCGDLAVGARQRVEILKALIGGARVLILDEPTAALAPPEVRDLFAFLRRLRDGGTTIILITHRMSEVMSLCDRVSVLRGGRMVGHREISSEQRPDGPPRAAFEADLVQLMIGRGQPPAPRPGGRPGAPVLTISGLSDGVRLGPLDLTVRAGEIVGVAGVEGNGQAELVELLVGVRRAAAGTLAVDGADVTKAGVRERMARGVAHIAEDRHAAAVAEQLPVVANAALGFTDAAPFARGPWWLSQRRMSRLATELVYRGRVRAPSIAAPVTALSGGNQQKLVVRRELARAPRLLIAAQPTRGLDVGATAAVHDELTALRDRGAGVLLVSLDLAEVLSVADRLVVMSGGRIAGEVAAQDADVAIVGAWMTGAGASGTGSGPGPAAQPSGEPESAAAVVPASRSASDAGARAGRESGAVA